MNYKQHLTINITIFFLILFFLEYFYNYSFSLKKILLYFFITVFLTLIPDVDSKNSKVTKVFFLIYFLLLFFGVKDVFENKIILGFEKILLSTILFLFHIFFSKKGKNHRSFSHSLIFGFTITFLLSIIFYDYNILYLYIFFILHLLEDKSLIKSIKKDFYFIKKIFK